MAEELIIFHRRSSEYFYNFSNFLDYELNVRRQSRSFVNLFSLFFIICSFLLSTGTVRVKVITECCTWLSFVQDITNGQMDRMSIAYHMELVSFPNFTILAPSVIIATISFQVKAKAIYRSSTNLIAFFVSMLQILVKKPSLKMAVYVHITSTPCNRVKRDRKTNFNLSSINQLLDIFKVFDHQITNMFFWAGHNQALNARSVFHFWQFD